MKIIDIHTHVGDLLYGQPLDEAYDGLIWTPGMITEWTGYRASESPPGFRTLAHYLEVIHNHQRNNMANSENLIKFSEPYGVTHSVLQPIEPVLSTGFTLAEVKKNRENARNHGLKMFTFASVDPRDPEKIEKLDRYMKAGCLGLKLHPIIQNMPATERPFFEILEAMRQYNKPVLFHSGKSNYYIPQFKRAEYGDAATYEKLIASFPDVPIILAHMNMAHPEVVWALAERYENIYVDATFQCVKNIRQAFKVMGSDRVMYASDCPFSLPKYAIKVGMKATESDPDTREKFFYKNAEALIGELQ